MSYRISSAPVLASQIPYPGTCRAAVVPALDVVDDDGVVFLRVNDLAASDTGETCRQYPIAVNTTAALPVTAVA